METLKKKKIESGRRGGAVDEPERRRLPWIVTPQRLRHIVMAAGQYLRNTSREVLDCSIMSSLSSLMTFRYSSKADKP